MIELTDYNFGPDAAGWADDPLVQLNNPVGGILRGRDAVRELYERVFAGSLNVQVTFGDAATYWLGN
ncbi:MAG TPA: hypothetical protein VGL05_10625 [Kribbella sp.]